MFVWINVFLRASWVHIFWNFSHLREYWGLRAEKFGNPWAYVYSLNWWKKESVFVSSVKMQSVLEMSFLCRGWNLCRRVREPWNWRGSCLHPSDSLSRCNVASWSVTTSSARPLLVETAARLCCQVSLFYSVIHFKLSYIFLFLQAQSDKIKLQLRIEELQHKYEPKGDTSACEPSSCVSWTNHL